MRSGLQIGVAALALFVAGAAVVHAFRDRTGPAPPDAQAETPRLPAAPVIELAPLPKEEEGPYPGVPSGLPEWHGDAERATPEALAVRVALLLLEIDAGAEARRVSGRPASAEEQTDALFLGEEAQELAGVLSDRLIRDPRSWRAVIDVLGSFGQVRVPLKAVEMVAGALTDAGESVCIDMLRESPCANARRIAAGALSQRDTAESLFALLNAAKLDEVSVVRLQAVYGIARWKRRSLPPYEEGSIDQILRDRAQWDEDPGVRQTSERILGNAPPAALHELAGRESSRRRCLRLK